MATTKKPRSIFEDVGSDGPVAAAPAAAGPVPARGPIRVWLMLLFALVVAMIVVGGMTRLTDAGLSITEWRPVAGAMPPVDAAAWEAEFALYRASPQYELLNRGMSLTEFKTIYWWEWGHRQLGRVIGAAWALGLVWFLARRQVPPGWTPRLLGLGALGGVQGAIGWWMVASGLQGGMTSVASYRLAVHLGLAFVILGLITWYVLRLGRTAGELLQARRQRSEGLMRWGTVLAGLVFFQVVLGALVAGIDAGRTYTTWPLMGGEVFPSVAFNLEPAWTNFLENPALVQFNHRLVGYLLVAAGVVAWATARRSSLGDIRRSFGLVAGMLAVQMLVGIVTVLQGAPWPVAILHQLGAVVVFVLVLRARFAALYPRPERIARGRV